MVSGCAVQQDCCGGLSCDASQGLWVWLGISGHSLQVLQCEIQTSHPHSEGANVLEVPANVLEVCSILHKWKLKPVYEEVNKPTFVTLCAFLWRVRVSKYLVYIT